MEYGKMADIKAIWIINLLVAAVLLSVLFADCGIGSTWLVDGSARFVVAILRSGTVDAVGSDFWAAFSAFDSNATIFSMSSICFFIPSAVWIKRAMYSSFAVDHSAIIASKSCDNPFADFICSIIAAIFVAFDWVDVFDDIFRLNKIPKSHDT